LASHLPSAFAKTAIIVNSLRLERQTPNTMAEPQRDFDKLQAEQEKEDAAIFDDLEKESKAFDKVTQSSSQSTHRTVAD
jgi:hypothetical protein